MPTGWNDLSNEIRKIIIEYVVAHTTVTFIPRHAATRGTRKKEEAKAQQPPNFPLLLVSKQFLTYAELNDAVLKNATIKYQNGRDLTMLDARFGKGGIESIRSLHLVYQVTWISRKAPPNIPSKLRSRLKRLQNITANIDLGRGWLYDYTGVADLITVAKGQHLAIDSSEPWNGTTEIMRRNLRSILEEFLYIFPGRAVQWFAEFLQETPKEPFERVIRFDVYVTDSLFNKKVIEPIEFSSALRCFRLVNHTSIIMPQRLSEYFTKPYPSLAAINEVELDKYYAT